MVCTLLGHVVLDGVPGEAGAAFYTDVLGGVVATPPHKDGAVRINVGDHVLHLAGDGGGGGSPSSHAWSGHLEFWTREPLDDLHSRLAAALDADSLVRHEESADDRVVATDPWGNMLIVRSAPAQHEVKGSPPGGYGALVAISRVVWAVRSGTTAAIRAFWVSILGSMADHRTVADGRISYCLAPFGSGQQLIFEERRDEDGVDLVEANLAEDEEGDGAPAAAELAELAEPIAEPSVQSMHALAAEGEGGGVAPSTRAKAAGRGHLIFYVQVRLPLIASYGFLWRLTMTSDGSDGFWWFLMASDGFWWRLMASDSVWWHLMASNGF